MIGGPSASVASMPARGSGWLQGGSVQAALLGGAASTMFLDIEFSAGGLRVRIFDIVLVLLALNYAFGLAGGLALRIPAGAGPFLLIYTTLTVYTFANAWFLSSPTEGFVRLFQMLLFLAFFQVGTNLLARREDFWAFLRAFLVALWVISIYNAGYHIATGHLFGFKDLGNQKLSHSYSLVLSVLMLAYGPGRRRPWMWAIVVGAVVLTLMAGERKGWLATLAALICVAAITNTGRISSLRFLGRGILLAGLAVPVIILIESALPRTYLSKQVDSVTEAAELMLSDDDPMVAADATRSNITRVIANRRAMTAIEQNPVIGMGVGNFAQDVKSAGHGFGFHGVHNEYLRLTAETGLLGLGLYMAAVGAVWWRARDLIRVMPRLDSLQRFRVRTGVAMLVYGLIIIAFKATSAVNLFLVFIGAVLLFAAPVSATAPARPVPAAHPPQLRRVGPARAH